MCITTSRLVFGCLELHISQHPSILTACLRIEAQREGGSQAQSIIGPIDFGLVIWQRIMAKTPSRTEVHAA